MNHGFVGENTNNVVKKESRETVFVLLKTVDLLMKYKIN